VNNFARGGVEETRFVSHGSGLVTRFNGQAVTPEPTSILLLATGAAITAAKRRALSKKPFV